MKAAKGPSAPDPLAAAEQARDGVYREFRLVTDGRDPLMDTLGVCCAALSELNPNDRTAMLTYLTSRYAGPQ